MLLKFYLTKFTCGELGSSLCKMWEPLLARESLCYCVLVICVWPLCGSGGIRGKKSTPSVGWDVLVKSVD
jgi:hypothetical protein